jgi:negative regulator of replication initiation
MFKDVIRISENTDINEIILIHESKLLKSGLNSESIAQATKSVQSTVRDFKEQGDNLLSVGSAFSSTRSISGTDYEINVVAQFGVKFSMMSQILNRILRRA